jgi:S-adenosylmethionine hydrolase
MNDPSTFRPCGIVTFTTDFGLRDPFVGVMKGQVLRRHAPATLVDLMHEIAPQDVDEAGFWLARSYHNFPTGTVHVAVVDPGVGTSRPVAIVEVGGHVLLAPDNGLLSELVDRVDGTLLRRLDSNVLPSLGIERLSATFHGRDLFAPLAAELLAGRTTPASLGPEVSALARGHRPPPVAGNGWVEGVVVTIDRFGNLITNIDGVAIARLASPTLSLATHRLPLSRTYADVPRDGCVALVNAFEVIEIAVNGGSAAATLGLGRGTTVRVESGEVR